MSAPMPEWRTPIPVDVRFAVLRRAERCCEQCGSERPLELHHTTYDLFDVTGYHRDQFEVIFGRETPDVLLALCRDCHLGKHLGPGGQFWRDPKDAQEQRDHFEHLLLDDYT